jgi:hypothetical protein
MRRIVFCLILLLLASSNGLYAQTVKEVVDSVKSGMKSGSIKSVYDSVKDAFAVKAASAEMLVGAWTYLEPAVLVTSGNLLAKAVGNVSASSLEKLLAEYLEKANVRPDNTTFTFREDGTFIRSLSGRKAKGVWMTHGEKLLLAVKNVQTASATTHLVNDTLTMVVEAKKIMDALESFGTLKDNTTTKALSKLSKGLSGIQGGFVLVRKTAKKK